MDFIESGKLATDAVKFFVLDEADRLLDSGSQELVMKLFSKLPKAATGTQRLQVCSTPHEHHSQVLHIQTASQQQQRPGANHEAVFKAIQGCNGYSTPTGLLYT